MGNTRLVRGIEERAQKVVQQKLATCRSAKVHPSVLWQQCEAFGVHCPTGIRDALHSYKEAVKHILRSPPPSTPRLLPRLLTTDVQDDVKMRVSPSLLCQLLFSLRGVHGQCCSWKELCEEKKHANVVRLRRTLCSTIDFSRAELSKERIHA